MNYLMNLFVEWCNKFGFPEDLCILLFSVIPFILIISCIIISVIFLVLAERKLLAYFQQRKGPNRVGCWGILQTIADAIKLLCKENIELRSADKMLFSLAPICSFASVIVLWCIIPYNSEFVITNSTITILIYIFVASFPTFLHFLAGISSNNKYSLLGAFRSLSLSISYSVPVIFIILSIIFLSNSMDLNSIIQFQNKSWFIFTNIVGFIIFYISTLAELNRTPFDLPEAESELVCGYHTEYSGMRFAMFFLGEYANLIVSSMLVAILFFGGYLPPFGIYISDTLLGNCCIRNYFIYFEQTIWLIIKTSLIIFSIIWIRATLPRLTQKSILNLFWKYLIPISIINLIFIITLGEI